MIVIIDAYCYVGLDQTDDSGFSWSIMSGKYRQCNDVQPRPRCCMLLLPAACT